MSDELLIRHGAPTLAGIKTSSLFPCTCRSRSTLLGGVRRFGRRWPYSPPPGIQTILSRIRISVHTKQKRTKNSPVSERNRGKCRICA